ncbi:bifunctional riboflavin kinase/FAD synthetase [Chloroflexota bacterium]
MQTEEELARLSPNKDTLLTIGVFDGVHLGHKYLLSQLTGQAKERKLLSGVVTFCQHPLQVLSPQTELLFLTDLDRRIALLRDEGVDIIALLSFTRETAELNPTQFIHLLKKHLRMKGLVIGPDFALGKNREGDIDTLRRMGEETGFTITIIPPVMIANEVISSTAIRKAITDGDMEKTASFIGHPLRLYGQVVTGVGRGGQMGFPTANIAMASRQALPPDGVYATWAYIDGKAHASVTNVGKRPTFGDNKRTVEVHILNYPDNLYGREMEIDVAARLRGEKQFNNAGELAQQIAEDIKQGKAILCPRGED